MYLSSLSLALNRPGAVSLEQVVASLFAAGEQGAWYDPSGNNTTWRRNRLTYTQEFDNAYWVKAVNTSVSADAGAAPDATSTADKLSISSVTSDSGLYKLFQLNVVPHTLSLYAKADGANFVYLFAAGGTEDGQYFNLTNGTKGNTVGSNIFASTITDVGSGWYRCSISFVRPSGNSYLTIMSSTTNATGRNSQVGTAPNGVLIWGAQLEEDSIAPTAYQRIITPEITYLSTVQAQPLLFQDAAGTLPVTEVEQPVGLMLDRRKGLAVSTNAGNASATGQFTTPSAAANQVTGDIDIRARAILQSWASGSTQSMVTKRDSGGSNMGYALRVNTTGELSLIFGTSSTTFATATSSAATGFAANSTNWIRVTRNSSTGDVLFYTSANGSTWSQLGATISTASGNIYASTSALIVGTGVVFSEPCVGKIYRAQVYAGAVLQVDFDPTRYTGGSTFVAATGETWTLAGTTGSITPDGNHAYQTGSAARPVLRARYNLLTYSEQFDNGAWNKQGTSVSTNVAVAPDSTQTADKIIPDAASGVSLRRTYYNNAIPATVGATYTASAYCKAAEYGFVTFVFSNSGSGASSHLAVDLSNGSFVVGGTAPPAIYGVTSVGNGWYRAYLSFVATGANLDPATFSFYATPTQITVPNAASYTTDGTSGIYIWGADLRVGTSAGDYQRIAAATDYATTSTITGQPFRPYLAFDGADDKLTIADTDGMNFGQGSFWMQAGLESLGASDYNVIWGKSLPAGDNIRLFVSSANQLMIFWGTDGQSYQTGPTITKRRPQVMEWGVNAAASQVFYAINAVEQTANITLSGTGSNTNPATIGLNSYGTGYQANMNLYGMIIRKGTLPSAADRGSARRYMASKSGVTL